MRLLYDSKAHERDRLSWKTVVQLNVIVAVRTLVEAVEQFDRDDQQQQQQALSQPRSSVTSGEEAGNDHSSLLLGGAGSHQSTSSTSSNPSNRALLARLRLAPLLSLEPTLRKRLGAVGEEEELSGRSPISPGWQSKGDSGNRNANPTLMLKAGWQDRLFHRASNPQNQNKLSVIADDNVSIAESNASGIVGHPLSSQNQNQNQTNTKRSILGRRRSSSAIGKQKDSINSSNSPLPESDNLVAFSNEEDPTPIFQSEV